MRRLSPVCLILAGLTVLSACADGERVMSAGQGAQRASRPAHYEGDGMDCGSYVVEYAFRDDGVGAAEQDCLSQAARSGHPAFMSMIAYGTEGHPSRWGYQVQGSDAVLVEHDWNDDPLGSSGIDRVLCQTFMPGTNGIPVTSGCSSASSSAPGPQRVDVGLYHCGVQALEVDGEQWIPVGAEFDATNAPYDETFSGSGTFEKLDPDHAIFLDDLGERIEFRRDDQAWPPPSEGCD